MFSRSSTQQRILGNVWRQIKFTREAWRCKLLAANIKIHYIFDS